MKIQFLITIAALCGLSYSCQKCELIDQTITAPPKSCSGTFRFILAESSMDTNYLFSALDKPLIEPLNPVQKDGPFGFATPFYGFRSNYSAYDSLNEIYAFEFFRPVNPKIGFYSNQTVTNLSTNSLLMDNFVAPVFQGEHLYIISLEKFTSEFQYSIGEVNPVTGQDGVGLTAGLVTTNNPVDPQFFSSAAAKNGLIYFLGGTILIEYNSNNNTSRHLDIDPTYDPVLNQVTYLGLEYDPNQDLLFCMKTGPNANDVFTTTLMTIKILPAGFHIAEVFDIANKLPKDHSPQINLDFYSTAFDACDTTYYITEINTPNPLTTNFIELSLSKQTLTNHLIDGYVFGMEYIENQ